MDSYISTSVWISFQPYTAPHQVLWKAEAASIGATKYQLFLWKLLWKLIPGSPDFISQSNWKILGSSQLPFLSPHFKHKSNWTLAPEDQPVHNW